MSAEPTQSVIPSSKVSVAGDPAGRPQPGGGFLFSPPFGEGVFIREDMSEEQRDFGQVAREFFENEVLPQVEAIEAKAPLSWQGQEYPAAVAILKQAGELGLLGVDIPEAYGGLGSDKLTSFHVAECCAGCASAAATIGAHIGIGTLPIVLFGNEEQRQTWLPRLAAGEVVSCYALTEPGHGSDALTGKATAEPAGDGQGYHLTGEKMFITNGAWADLGIVFARVDGKYSAFIVDLHVEGVTRGAEEKKMGIWGSSTTSLGFDRAYVPASNMLGRPGDGPAIALNILNLGRLKLGLADLGQAKYAIGLTIKFASDRRQFGQPVITFDMQKGYLADMVAAVYALDAVAYRVGGDLEDALTGAGGTAAGPEVLMAVLKSHALEASIVKVLGSETLSDVASRAVRMHGGYGFAREYHVERVARDNVIDNIFEGTNDINRLVIFDTLVRNVVGATVGFREFLESTEAWLRGEAEADVAAGSCGTPAPAGSCGTPAPGFEAEYAALLGAKRAAAWTLERCLRRLGKDVKNHQQVMAVFSDLAIRLYAADSALVRAARLAAEGRLQPGAGACARLVLARALDELPSLTRRALHAAAGDEYPAQAGTLDRLLAAARRDANVVALRREVAEAAVAAGKYPY